jgi:hypothetical protein|tara:strand:- start:291 stop:2153 length:1863 start_codon:yes stop_codon:yes gene_type:complete
MQINKGEIMNKNKDRIAGVDTSNMAGIYDTMAKTMPSDQIYRELIKNSLESGARMKERDPNFKGTILIGESKLHPKKLCVMDNCEGIPQNKILPLTGDLAATYKQSEDGNFGHGTKAAAFANHKYGILYHSLFVDDGGKGSGVRMYYNGKNFAAKYLPEFDSCIRPMTRDEFPPLIREAGHGNGTTVMGNSPEENTLLPPPEYEDNSLLKAGREDSIHWLAAYVNTKFFEIPDYMTIKVEVKREGRTNYEKINGHKSMLNQYSALENRNVLDFDDARIHWWLMSNDFGKRNSRNDAVLNGQLTILHQKEIYDIEYNYWGGGKNPLKSWGLPFSYKDVVLVVEFKNMQATLQRTTLYSKKRVQYTKSIPALRELFKENMPQVIADNEEKMQKEYSKKLLDNESLSKKISKYLRNLFAMENSKGDEFINGSLPLGGTMPIDKGVPKPPRPKPPRPRPFIPGEEFGPDPIMIGIKDLEGKKKAKKARPNAMPRFELREDESFDVEYDYDGHVCYLYNNCSLFDEYAKLAHIKTKNMQFGTIRELTIKVIQDLLGTRIAITRARDLLSEDAKRELLTNEKALLMVIMSPFEITDKVVEYTKHLDKRNRELDSSSKELNGAQLSL